MTGSPEWPAASFAISMVGGLLISLQGIAAWFYPEGPYYGMMGGYYGGMFNGFYGMMRGFGGGFYGFTPLGAVAGVVVLVGAAALYARPSGHAAWGAVVLVFSALSLFGAGGFLVGGVLGIVGGILAIVWVPSGPASQAAANLK